MDIDSGFGGFAEKFLDEVKEECRSASIVTYGLTPSKWGEDVYTKSANYSYISSNVANRQSKRNINVGIAMAQLTSRSTLYVPLSVGGGWEQAASGVMDYDRNVLHHKYCMLGMAIDSMTLPFRKVSRSQFGIFACVHHRSKWNARRNVASLSLVCPLRGQTNVYEQSKSNSLSNNIIGMKLTAKNVYINGDYGRVERYGSKRTDGQIRR